ncbi:uncharacterized protein PHALS_05100 [Plasmopara halstedii]|uniref:Uncharacterized protein n=1 Tax=Plasmopara halstedii TaxID=4781 RepID=A0A0P1AZ38_PLAHL|nr:uncharacterized protein PHALS_05100 [Plasmopara halstedii]CEG47764.1 hypothetical protein PHALS_05100 [Plasmopara halstedii]|eukprot:XP_024584133.1 hypothetical protein PHALS_05100 [Plasmopara halstedii]
MPRLQRLGTSSRLAFYLRDSLNDAHLLLGLNLRLILRLVSRKEPAVVPKALFIEVSYQIIYVASE